VFSADALELRCDLVPGDTSGAGEGVLIDADSVELALRCSRALRESTVFGSWTLLIATSPEGLPIVEDSTEVDDFILRPFDWEEVRARLRWDRRRHLDTTPAPGPPFIDLNAREVRWGDRVVPLTVRELALIQCLRRHEGSVLSREALLAAAWGQSYRGSTRTVDTHISRLRTKLAGLLRVETIRATGYRPFFSSCRYDN
jgi:hypothetical protein